jgi:predicted transport protein
MALFKINGAAVKKITSKELDLENTLQNLFEQNLEELLNIVFLSHQYSTSFGGRIDTVGIDSNGALSIIEYKKNENDNFITRGLSHLRWFLDHKADFENLCQEKKVGIELDWDSPRVICIAESYSSFDLHTAIILPIKVELLRFRIYAEDILCLEAENYQKIGVSKSGLVRKAKQVQNRQEVLQKYYTVDDHLKNAEDEIKYLFVKLREKIISLDTEIREDPQKHYVAYKLGINFVQMEIYRNQLKVCLNIESGHLNDPNSIAQDMKNPKHIFHYGNGDYEVKLDDIADIEKVFSLIRQSYDLNK